jgi:hypothetical protein
MERGNGCANLVTFFFLLLTLLVCAVVGLLLTRAVPPPVALAPRTPTLAEVKAIPTDTPTATPSLTPLPSNTLPPTSTLRPTNTPTPSRTVPPTLTPSETPSPTLTPQPPTETLPPSITPIPPTASNTRRPTITLTPSRTLPPTRDPNLPTNTPTGFPFRIQQGTPQLVANTDAATGCAFQGIGGQVFDQQGRPVLNVQIVVTSKTNATVNLTLTPGSNPNYGNSGWLAQVGAQAARGTFEVEVRNTQGVSLSPKATINFPGTCEQNLALVNFQQTRPF